VNRDNYDSAICYCAKTFSITTLCIKGLVVILSIPFHYAECHVLFIAVLNAIMLSVIMPCVVAYVIYKKALFILQKSILILTLVFREIVNVAM